MALNNVPLTGQTLGVTRVPINQNFSVINAAFLVDHVEYNTAGQGQHNQVTFPVQMAMPAFGAGVNGLYNLNDATTTKNEVYVHKQNVASSIDVPFTASILGTAAVASITEGWSYLPSGVLLKWGLLTANNSGTATLNLNTGGVLGPNFTRTFTVYGSSILGVAPFALARTGVATLQLTGAPNQRIYYLAIGTSF